MISEETREKWKHKLETIEEAYNLGCVELSEWEQSFIDSISIQLSDGRELSFKQSSVLGKIYDKIG